MAYLDHWLWLSTRPALSHQNRLHLLEVFGSPEAVYLAEREAYLRIESFSKRALEGLCQKSLEREKRILERCQRENIQLLTIQDGAYPARLAALTDAPCLLYVKGKLPVFDQELAVAVVGTRHCSPYGMRCAERLGADLARNGVVLVSGLARGIDTIAMQAALQMGGTVAAVLGGGIDVIYPKENRALQEDIAQVGVLLSEYPPGTACLAEHFPQRNRILSGLCVAALVVEAPVRSGALITAQQALEQGRDVYAVPGPIDAESCRGSNALIRDGACLVSCAEDLLQDYTARFPQKQSPTVLPLWRYQQTTAQVAEVPHDYETTEMPRQIEQGQVEKSLPSVDASSLPEEQQSILKLLGEKPLPFEDLLEQLDYPLSQVQIALTMLEIAQYIQQHPGHAFSRRVQLEH